MGIFKSGGAKTRTGSGKTIIATGCKISGEIKDLDGPLHIDGRVDGIVETEYDVSIGDKGILKGLIKAKNVVVSGVLEGKVACESIDILSTGKLLGEVICGELMIEAGGKFIGESRELTEGGLIVSFPEAERMRLANQLASQFASSGEKLTGNTQTEAKIEEKVSKANAEKDNV